MSSKEPAVVLRDLQSLLRGSIGKDAIVVEYETNNLLGKGENYSSTMLKVDAVVKRSEDADKERLSLVAKMMPSAQYQKSHFKATEAFTKEIFVFEKLAPAYRRLEAEAGVKAAHLIDVLPKFYGGRLTRNSESPYKADEDAVLLMENIKTLGYYTGNRFLGLDFEHAKFAITELARYHALGIATKCKNPPLFEEAKKILNPFPYDMKDDFGSVNDNTFKTICEDPRTARYEDRLKACLDKYREWESLVNVEREEPWVGVSHGDFWVNNMLFHQSDGKVDGIKFVDFQIANVCSPLKDLPYFLCSSINADVMDQHFDDLVDLYYEKFIQVLRSVGGDASPFSRASFVERLRKDSNASLYHILLAVKFIILEVSQDQDMDDIKSSVMLTGGSTKYLQRARRIVSKFIEKGWL